VAQTLFDPVLVPTRMKTLLLFFSLTMAAYAGAPVLCTPTLSSLMSALTTDYAVHVASTFTENPEAFIMIVENPDTETAAIIRITEQSSCLIFSGIELQHFTRPEGMAPPEASINRNIET